MHWHAVECSCERDEDLADVAGIQYVLQVQVISSDLYENVSDLPVRIKTKSNNAKQSKTNACIVISIYV